MSLIGIQTRAAAAEAVRSALREAGMAEVIPTLMAGAIPTEPTIYPFRVDGGQWLATSPEAVLKQAMAAGMKNCFAISPAFRALEGAGRWHQPEFLMAEWYQKDTDWMTQITFTQSIIMSVIKALKITYHLPTEPWPIRSWLELWQTYVSIDLMEVMTDTAMVELAQRLGYTTNGTTWEQLFNQIAFNMIEPHFPKEPFFLTDFPARISPLALPQPERPDLAERFELLIDGVELANGNSERFDEPVIREIFTQEKNLHQPALELDEAFLDAVKQLTGQRWAGVGLGIDRLTALVTDTSVAEIQQVNVMDS